MTACSEVCPDGGERCQDATPVEDPNHGHVCTCRTERTR